MLLFFERGVEKPMTQYLRRLTEMQYERTPYDLARGTFRVRGDVLELWPAYEDDAVRIEFFGDEIDKITRIDPITGRTSGELRPPGRLSPNALRHAARAPAPGDGEHPRGARSSAWSSCGRRTVCWRRSGCRSARCSIWR